MRGLMGVIGVSLTGNPFAEATEQATPLQTKAADTCFADQLSGPQADAIAASSVLVAVRGSDGKIVRSGEDGILAGSGFIVRDSGSKDNPHLRLITDAHVVAALPADAKIEITTSDGSKVGYAAIAALGTDYNKDVRRNDLAVLEMTEFVPGQKDRYDAAPGIPLGPQLRSGYVTGIVSAPAGITGGNSGGPVINAAGQVIGVVQASLEDDATIATRGVKIQHPFKTGTHDLEKVDLTLDRPNRLYATTIVDGAIRDALGKAGHDAPVVPAMTETPVTISGVPKGVCVISTTTVKELDFTSIADFKRIDAEPVPAELQFKNWNDPKRAAAQVNSLLTEAKTQLPDDKQLAATHDRLASVQDMNRMDLTGLPQALIGWANAVNDEKLAGRLVDATYNVDGWIHRAEFGGPLAQPQAAPRLVPPPKP